MIDFLLLTVVCLFTALSVRRLIFDRFPHPADLATVVTFYYAVPLAVAGIWHINPRALIFLHGYAADPDLARTALTAATLAIGSMALGRAAAARTPHKPPVYYAKLSHFCEVRVHIAFLAMVALIGGGVLLFGVDAFLSGYAQESLATSADLGQALLYFGVTAIGLIVAYTIPLLQAGRSKFLYLTLAAAIVTLVVILLVRSKRLEVVSALIPALILLLANRSKVSAAAYRFIGGGIAIAALVAVSIIRIDDDADTFTLAFYFLAEGLYAGHSLPGIIGNLNMQTLDLEYGQRFANALVAIIPSFLWADKADVLYVGDRILESVAPLGATSLLAETYLQGQMTAVIGVHLVLGALFEKVYGFARYWQPPQETGMVPARFGLYILVVGVFIPHFRDGIVPSVKLTIQMIFFMAVLSSFVAMRRRPAGKPTATGTRSQEQPA